MKYLILIFIIVPALEIGLFILAGKAIGVISTVSLIIVSGIVGAYLAKRQGMSAIRNVQNRLRHGQAPGIEMLDGVCILFGGILLLSPGFITDFIGILLLIPYVRNANRPLLLKSIKKWVDRKQVYIYR